MRENSETVELVEEKKRFHCFSTRGEINGSRRCWTLARGWAQLAQVTHNDADFRESWKSITRPAEVTLFIHHRTFEVIKLQVILERLKPVRKVTVGKL